MGSAAFGNVARAALGFARDTEAEDDSCVISQVKNNLGRLDLPSLRYRIDTAWIDTEEGQAEVGKLVMLGESDRSVADILRDRSHDADASDTDAAVEWLIMFLTEVAVGGYAPAREILAAAAGEGISKTTLHRARKKARIRSTKAGFGGGWVWVLPTEDSSEGSEDSTFQNPESSEPSAESSVRCLVCGNPLDPALAGIGEVTHPSCDPTGTVGRDPAYVARPDPVAVVLDELFDDQLPIPESAETRP